MITFHLIRHGQASFGSPDYDRLSPVGEEQASLLGRHLAAQGLSCDLALCGTLRRQADTARLALEAWPAGARPPLAATPDLNEYESVAIVRSQVPAMSRVQPEVQAILDNRFTNRAAFQKVYETAMFRWISGRHPAPGVETWEEVRTRVRGALNRAAAQAPDHGRVLVFTSGGPIAALAQEAWGLASPVTLRLTWIIWNSADSEFTWAPAGWNLKVFNRLAHLEPPPRPGLITLR
ncbi:MAG: histidine phosphatase family protein [Deltaproteobacteria bacterium]|nr:histidine phosphatase family protein [Deltaproteobacteria bacterium]